MNRRALAIGGGAALVILLAWWFLLWSPRNAALNAAKARTEAAVAQQQQLNIQLQTLRKAQRDEPLKRARLERLRAAVPDEPAPAELILSVNDAATKSGIDFLSIAPAVPAAGTIRVSISITGGYFQILDFVNRLNALPRILVIDSLSLTPQGTTSMSAVISGRTFTANTTATGVAPTTTTTTAPGATTTVAPTSTTVP